MKSFASDNYSSVSPEIIEYLMQINSGHSLAYGADEYTKKAREVIRKEFSTMAQVYFVFSGTAANVLSVKAAIKSYQSILGPDISHLNTKETGAPEANTGSKFIPVKSNEGKIDLDDLKVVFEREMANTPHSPRPRLLTVAQSTEYGTVYTIEELKNLAQWCKNNDLYFHIDACRVYNAAVALNCDLKDITTHSGADIISIGGTKNGLMFAEAVLIYNDNLKEDFNYLQKQSLQLYSKMRYLSAQYIPFFETDLWKKNALQANNMAKLLETELQKIEEVKINRKVETNHIFANFPRNIILELQKDFPFYIWDNTTGEIRLVTSFDNTKEDIEAFINKIKSIILNS